MPFSACARGRARSGVQELRPDAQAPQPLRLAYLTSQYPATSHTFIGREVVAVRNLGLKLDTFSVRSPSQSELSDPALADESSRTFTVLSQPASRFIAAHLKTLVTRPGAYLRTFARALDHRPPGLRALGLSVAHFAEAVVLADEIKRRGVTRLHNHFANSAATVGYLATRLLGLPWSFTIHGISETDYPAGLLLGRKIESADFVACVSYFGRAQAMRLVAPKHWNKLHVVHCGLAFECLPQLSEEARRKRIICVGRLSPEKGQGGLLSAFREIAQDHPETELVLVGDGPLAAELKAGATELGLDDRIRFTGRLGELDTLEQIASAEVLVVPSFMEGLPIVLMEAMAVGTAVIASRVAGIPELVHHGKNGLLFTPSNWAELSDCMRRLLRDDAFRQRLADSGRAAVSDGFDIRQSAEQLSGLFEGGHVE